MVLFALLQLVLGFWQQSSNNSLRSEILKLQKAATQKEASNKLAEAIEADKLQAVFLSNGQVYFGHLSFVDEDNYKLTKVYYLTESSSLVKLGEEAHKPQDVMYIPKSTVLFWENLKDAKQFDGQLKD